LTQKHLFRAVSQSSARDSYNAAWFAHLFVTVLAWFTPFLFDWRWVAAAFALVLLQFRVFGACLMNRRHNLPETDDHTFYAHLLENLGFRFNRRRVKIFVRRWLYPLLGCAAYGWQVLLGQVPLIF
jgi:DNA segregation ATPase FtsK/SpoIIIE-like protein